MTSGTTSVGNLDVGILAADSVSRGYMTDSGYLIDLEAGFELWQGGAGLTDSYSVNVNSGGGTTAAGPVVGYEGLCLDDRAAKTTRARRCRSRPARRLRPATVVVRIDRARRASARRGRRG
jgi:hypothetical protein